MNSKQSKNSTFYNEFQSGINKIISQTKNDEFHNKLYYSNVISLMVGYYTFSVMIIIVTFYGL